MTATDPAAWRTLQRAVFPLDDPDRLPLYIRGGAVLDRCHLQVAAGEKASFATYFGAFPAAYWAAGTQVSRVRLALQVDGAAAVIIRRTDAAGHVSTLGRDDAVTGEWAYEADISDADGWLWCEVIGIDGDAVVSDVRWEALELRAAAASVTVCITTFNREADCVRLLERFAADPALLARLDRIIVADQGTRPLAAAPGFAEVAAALGDTLRPVEQANLGGSGGFSRGMIDAVAEGSSHALLLDDDVDLETESVLRLVAFAESAPVATIVGAQMLSLIDPTRLHSFGERVDRSGFWWGPVDAHLADLDLAVAGIENTPALSRRIDVDFNGWWMCLIPTATIGQVGASLPYFIKWDDAEFGLRAAAHGVPTVTLPGAALWHMPWTAKDDGLDWQAYFQLRNRLVTALLHGGPRARTAVLTSFAQDVNHLLCAQYGSVSVRNLALRDILRGPEHLDPVLAAGPARPGAVLAARGQVIVPDAELPVSAPHRPGAPRAGRVATVARFLRVVGRQLRRARPVPVPPRLVRSDGKWWALGLLDAAVVEAAAGGGAFVLRRDRGVMWRELRAAVMLRLRLLVRWRRLAESYRAASPELSSATAWRLRCSGPDAASADRFPGAGNTQ